MAQINFSLDFASRKAKNSLKRGGHRGSTTSSRNVSGKVKTRKEQTLPKAASRWASSSRIPQDMITIFRGTDPTGATDTGNPRPCTVAPIQEHETTESEFPYAVWVEYYLSKLPFVSGDDHYNRSRKETAVHMISAQLERLVLDVMQMFDNVESVNHDCVVKLGKSLVVLGETIQEVAESWTNENIV